MDSDSDAGSILSKYSSVFQAFIHSLSPQIVKRMKKYLDDYKRIYEYKGKNDYKIVLYEDILIIYRIKQNQQWVFQNKNNQKQMINRLVKQLKRSFITIKDRLRKKLAHLNEQQLFYLMDLNKSLTFRDNTSVINTDDWPQHLKIINKRNRSVIAVQDEENIINLESSERSERSRSNRSQRSNKSQISQRHARGQTKKRQGNQNDVDQFKKRIEGRRNASKTNVMKQIEKIMSESQGQQNQSKRKQIKSPLKNSPSPDQKIYDLQDPIEKEIFLDKVIEKWQNKHMSKSYFDSNKMLMQSKICYNFKSREYIFLNPQVMRSVWNNLNQQCLRNVIKSKSSQKKEKLDKQLSQEKNHNRRNNMMDNQSKGRKNYFTDIYEQNQEDIMRCTKHLEDQLEQPNNSTLKKFQNETNQRQLLYSFENPIIQVSQLQESNKKRSYEKSNHNNSQRFNETNNMVKIKNPIKMLEEIASKYRLNQVSEQARDLILKGMAISQRLRRQSGQKVSRYQDDFLKQKEKQKKQIWQEQQDQPDRQRQSHFSSQENNNDGSKPMVYWFNNDPDLYEIYQQRPYEMGHLLWTQQQDELLHKANQNLQKYFDDFKSLIDEKTPKYLISRIRFLKINPSVELYSIISKNLQQQPQ